MNKKASGEPQKTKNRSEKSKMTNYWIFKVKDEEGGLYGRKAMDIFLHRTKEGFWGIRELDENGKHETNASLLKKGDSALFYLVSKSSSRFIGSCVLDSDFLKLDAEQAKNIIHREFIDPDQGVFIKNVDRWAKTLSVDSLRDGSPSANRSSKFGSFFQGSIKKIKNTNDYQAIINAHKQVQ